MILLCHSATEETPMPKQFTLVDQIVRGEGRTVSEFIPVAKAESIP